MCRLNHALYGLKQVLLAWFERLSIVLLGLGFVNSKANSFLVLQSPVGILLILIYVDDVIVTGSNSSQVIQLIHNLVKSSN